MKYKRVTCLPIRALAVHPSLTLSLAFSARVKSSWLRKAANTALLVAVTSVIGGCVTGNTLAIARGSTEKDTRGVENVNEEPHPEIYALVPLAVAADVALTPVYIVYTLGCFATGHLPY